MAGELWFAQLVGLIAFLMGVTAFWQKDDQAFRRQLTAYCAMICAHFFLMGAPAAGIAAAMIAKGNPLHIKYINKSIPGMLANVSPDGRVLNVSGGTAVMKDADGYRSISRDWIQGWGQGLALAFFAGVLNYDNVRSDGAL